MSKNMDIYAELDNFVEENEGQVSLTDVAKHFAEYGYKYAVEKYERIIKKLLEQDLGTGYANGFIDDLRKEMEE